MRRSTALPIGDVLKDVVEKLSQTRKKDTAKIISVWASCAGEELNPHTRPARLRRGALWVFVDDSAWFYQASLKKAEILKALQKKIGKQKIQKIQFRIGSTR